MHMQPDRSHASQRQCPFATSYSCRGGATPLHLAAQNQDSEAVLSLLEALLAEGGDIRAQDSEGATCLHVSGS